MSEQTKTQNPVTASAGEAPAKKGGLKPLFGTVKETVTCKQYWIGAASGLTIAGLIALSIFLYRKFKCKNTAANNSGKK